MHGSRMEPEQPYSAGTELSMSSWMLLMGMSVRRKIPLRQDATMIKSDVRERNDGCADGLEDGRTIKGFDSTTQSNARIDGARVSALTSE
jgi:hypothetical protein